MSYVMRFSKVGGPEVLERCGVEVAAPGPGEVRIRQQAVGLNFVDVYHRTGLYPLPLPASPGVEAAGVVEALGPGVEHLRIGQAVVYACAVGAYADQRVLPAWRTIALPESIDPEEAGGCLLRGLTAYMLLTKVYPVGAEMTVLVHAAAGGLGSVLVRWAKVLGATVIATVGSPEKKAVALGHGADHVLVGRDLDLAQDVAALTDGKGVHLAIDGIGGSTLLKSVASVRPFGMTASIGQIAGTPPPMPLSAFRSNGLSRPSVMAFGADPVDYAAGADAVFAMMQRGVFDRPNRRYALNDAASAHADLEAGRIVGSAIFIP